MTYIYLASPYSHHDPAIRHERYEAAQKAVHYLLWNRNWTYSPIVHCHELALRFRLPTAFEFWQEYNFAMLRPAKSLHILTIDGWEESRGVYAERLEAQRLSIPIYYMPLPEIEKISADDSEKA